MVSAPGAPAQPWDARRPPSVTCGSAARAQRAPTAPSGRGPRAAARGRWPERAVGAPGDTTARHPSRGHRAASPAPFPGPPLACEGWGGGPFSGADDLPHQPGGLRRRLADPDPGGLEGLLLRLRGAGRAGDDGAGVAHGLALGRGEPGDVADDRLGDVGLDEVRRPFLGVAADLADHHDRLGLRIVLESLQAVDVRGADDRVAPDADRGGEADVAQLVHHLVGQRAGLADQPDPALLSDVGRDDAGVRAPGADQAGAVRADDPGGAALGVRPEVGRVVHRDALGDDDGEPDLGVDGLDDRVLGAGRRHEDDADVRAGLLHGLGDAAEHRDAGAVEVDGLARLLGVHAADDGRAGGEHALGVLAPLGAGHALDDDLAVLVEEDRHLCSVLSEDSAPCGARRELASGGGQRVLLRGGGGKGGLAQAAASSAARRAAPSIVSTTVTSGWLASARIRRPSSTLLPSSRTTSGLVASSPRMPRAVTMPLATASQAVIPPNTLTNTLFTAGSERMISRPFAITSAEAPPPMSRKLAGRTPPNSSPA